MKHVGIKELAHGPLECSVFHASGSELLTKGLEINGEILDLLGKSDIDKVILLKPEDDQTEFIFNCKFEKKSVDTLAIGESVNSAVCDEDGTLLLDKGGRISDSLINTFKKRNIENIFQHRSSDDLNLKAVRDFKKGLMTLETPSLIKSVKVEVSTERQLDTKQLSAQKLEQMLNVGVELDITPSGIPLEEELQKKDLTKNAADAEKNAFVDMRTRLIKDARMLFSQFIGDRDISGDNIGAMAKRFIGGLIHDKHLLLNLANSSIVKTGESFILDHSINVTILSVNIATSLGYSKNQIFELAHGAFLHDVGMLKVPLSTIIKPGPLTTSERMSVNRHTISGINLLQKARKLPMATPFVAYQAHERMNGSGYPKGKSGKFIHPYARIVAVADIYDALISPRAYRKQCTPAVAMKAIVDMASKNLLDPEVVRAFLEALSLFPIGSWLELEGEKLARVVASSPRDYTRPIAGIIYENAKQVEVPYRIDLSEEKELKIVKPFDGKKLETHSMIGF